MARLLAREWCRARRNAQSPEEPDTDAGCLASPDDLRSRSGGHIPDQSIGVCRKRTTLAPAMLRVSTAGQEGRCGAALESRRDEEVDGSAGYQMEEDECCR